jgi:steroid 5-alpha reductase family enzyme
MYETAITFHDAWRGLTWSEKLLLSGVTIVSRSLARGKDDPRYEAQKKESGFWKTALFKIFLPEAAFLSFISLPITVPYSMGDIPSR